MANLTGAQLEKVRADLDALLADYGKKVGMNFDLGHIKYTDTSFRVKLEGTLRQETGAPPEDKTVQEFKKYAALFGLDSVDLGKKVVSGGRTFTVSGLKLSNRKFPLLMTGPQGGCYKFQINDSIKNQLGH